MKYLPLPPLFPLSPLSPLPHSGYECIPEAHWFAGLLYCGTDENDAPFITGIFYDETLVTYLSVDQSWDTEIGKKRAKEEAARKIADGRIVGMSPESLERPSPPDPYTSFTLTLLDGRKVSWYWWGDGEYDGFSESSPPGSSLDVDEDPSSAPNSRPIPEA